MSILTIKPQSRRRMSTELEELIRSAIQRGDLKPGQRLGSAKQLATHWKASYGAVRQSLETLAAKGLVERRARAGTFVTSNPEALGVRGESRSIIGLLVPDIRIPDYSLVTRCLQDAGHAMGYEILVSSTDNERERYDQSVMRHLSAGVGGLVLVAPQQARISLQTLVEIEKSGVPVVNYARTLDLVGWPTVETDIVQSVYLPIKHLCGLGRKKIAFLSYPTTGNYKTQMHYGLYRAIAEAGLSSTNILELTLPDEGYLTAWSDSQPLIQLLNQWLDEHKDVDAVCCNHCHIAVTVLSVLKQRGVRVPDDVAVTGAGRMVEYFGLPPGELTTVDTCMEKAASEMVRLLHQGGDGKSGDSTKVVAIQPELIIGRSTVGEGKAPAA